MNEIETLKVRCFDIIRESQALMDRHKAMQAEVTRLCRRILDLEANESPNEERPTTNDT